MKITMNIELDTYEGHGQNFLAVLGNLFGAPLTEIHGKSLLTAQSAELAAASIGNVVEYAPDEETAGTEVQPAQVHQNPAPADENGEKKRGRPRKAGKHTAPPPPIYTPPADDFSISEALDAAGAEVLGEPVQLDIEDAIANAKAAEPAAPAVSSSDDLLNDLLGSNDLGPDVVAAEKGFTAAPDAAEALRVKLESDARPLFELHAAIRNHVVERSPDWLRMVLAQTKAKRVSELTREDALRVLLTVETEAA